MKTVAEQCFTFFIPRLQGPGCVLFTLTVHLSLDQPRVSVLEPHVASGCHMLRLRGLHLCGFQQRLTSVTTLAVADRRAHSVERAGWGVLPAVWRVLTAPALFTVGGVAAQRGRAHTKVGCARHPRPCRWRRGSRWNCREWLLEGTPVELGFFRPTSRNRGPIHSVQEFPWAQRPQVGPPGPWRVCQGRPLPE